MFAFGDASFRGSAVGLIASQVVTVGAEDIKFDPLPGPQIWATIIFTASGESLQLLP